MFSSLLCSVSLLLAPTLLAPTLLSPVCRKRFPLPLLLQIVQVGVGDVRDLLRHRNAVIPVPHSANKRHIANRETVVVALPWYVTFRDGEEGDCDDIGDGADRLRDAQLLVWVGRCEWHVHSDAHVLGLECGDEVGGVGVGFYLIHDVAHKLHLEGEVSDTKTTDDTDELDELVDLHIGVSWYIHQLSVLI